MKIKRIYPKQIYAEIELSQEEIENLLEFLDNCTLDYGGNDKLKKAGEYVVKELFPALNELGEQLKMI